MSQANWGFKQVFGDRDSTEEPADGAPRRGCRAYAQVSGERARCAAPVQRGQRATAEALT